MITKAIIILSSMLIGVLPAHSMEQSSPPFISPTQKIDLNTADWKQLANTIKGIGKKRAQSIIRYRQSHGPFKSVDDLVKVKGFGYRFMKKNHAQLKEKWYASHKIELKRNA